MLQTPPGSKWLQFVFMWRNHPSASLNTFMFSWEICQSKWSKSSFVLGVGIFWLIELQQIDLVHFAHLVSTSISLVSVALTSSIWSFALIHKSNLKSTSTQQDVISQILFYHLFNNKLKTITKNIYYWAIYDVLGCRYRHISYHFLTSIGYDLPHL